MNRIVLIATALLVTVISNGQGRPSAGRIDRFVITSSGILTPRDISVWLPEGYDSTRRYEVQP